MNGVTVRAADLADWRAARDVRLRALADAPTAFASTLAREAAFDDAEWQGRVAPGNWMLAWDAGTAVGTAIGFHDAGSLDDERELVAMWVAPEQRGRGVARQLIDAVAGWAREQGAARLGLWVVEGNERARTAYLRAGFVATAIRQPLPGNPDVIEERLLRPLDQDPR